MAQDIGTLQVVDEADLTTLLFDCDDGTSTYARELHLRAPERGASIFRPTTGVGGVTTMVSDDLVLTEWKQALLFSASTYDAMAAQARELVRLFRRGGVLKFAPSGSADTYFIDYEPGSGFALFGEQPEDTFRALTGFAYPDGIPLQIIRQPALRMAELDPAVNKLTNCSMLADSNQNGTPDGWTLAAGTASIQALQEAFQLSHSGAVSLLTRDFTASAGTQVAVSVEARKVSGDRTVEIRLLSQPGGTVLATATITATSWTTPPTRYTVAGTVAGGDTGVRIEIRYTGGTNTTVSQFRDTQLETGTLTASAFRVGVEQISNDPATTASNVLGRRMVVHNRGSMWAPVKLTCQVEAGTPKVGKVLVGLRAADGVLGHRRLTDFLNETLFAQCDTTGNGWTRTLGTDTTSVADATDGSGGNVAQCTFATDPTVMARRVRLTRTTLLDSLRGYHTVIARLKPTAAGKFWVQLADGPSNADPAPYRAPEVLLDWLDATSFSYVDVILGTIYIPDDPNIPLGGTALEIWARRESGSGSMNFDHVFLVGVDPDPDDRLTIIEVPGGSRETWFGKDLVAPTNPAGLSAGEVKNNRIRLNAANEAAGTPPVGGLAWPVGRHIVTFKIDGNGDFDFTALVRNITDSTDAVSRAFTSRKPHAVGEIKLKFDSVTAKNYQAQIKVTGSIAAGEFLDVKRIIHEFVPYLGASEQIRTDPEQALLMKLDSSGNLVSYLGAAGGVPLWIPPGRSVLELIPIDIEIHSGATHGESKLARQMGVSARYATRQVL